MTSSARITSRQHAVVRQFRQAAAGTDADGLVVLDGEHLVREALDADVPVTTVLSDGRWTDLARRAETAGAAAHLCTSAVMAAASPVRTPSGICALARWRPVPVHSVLAASPALVIGLVDVQDPGNLGAAIRSADALGATGVLALGAAADPSGWKALRGSMGSAFRLPVGRGDVAPSLASARKMGLAILAAAPAGGRPPSEVDLTRPTLILLGREGGGLPAEVAADADEVIAIRMRPGIESLNVAVAAALLLDEARRQRDRSRA